MNIQTRKETPLISIIVPVFNAASTLEKCVRSVTEQTYKEIQIILVNNCSNDGSLELCQRLATKDDRIILEDLKTKGVSAARNRGVELASGEFITFIDADDWIDPNICDFFAKENTKHDYDLFYFSAQYHNVGNSLKSFLFAENVSLLSDNQKEELQIKVFAPNSPYFEYKTNTRFLGSVWGKFYKKDVLKKHNLHFATETIISEDVLFNTLALDYFDRIGYTRDCFYHYTQQTSSAQNHYRPNSEKYFDFVIDQIQQWLTRTKKNKHFVDAANCLFVHYLFGILKEDLAHKDNKLSLTQRCTDLKKILKKQKYQNILHNINKDYFSASEKILMLLMKNKLYRLTIILLRIYLR